MASTSIQRSRTAGSTKTKFTISMWVKKSANNAKYLMVNRTDDSNRGLFQFGGSDELLFQSKYSNTNNAVLSTNRKFRDTSAWYHFVLTGDSTLSTAADRLKLYVNGVRETSFASETQISQNGDFYMNEATTNGFRIGEKGDGSDYFDGLMSHIHFTDGYAYQASTFGSTDATTGEWKINTSPSVTYGTNGFFILKDGNSVTDQSGNSNNFTVGNGTLTKTEDCPSNVFATLNPLVRVAGNITYSSGNTKIARSGSAEWRTSYSTLAMTTGKYYFEALSDAGANNVIGIRELQNADGSTAGSGNDYPGYTSQGWSLYNYNGTVYNNNVTSGSAIGTFTNGDYIGVFLDCDNQKLYFSKNGTMLNTTGYSISAVPYVFGVALYDDGGGFSCNFGNGAFGSTQLTGTTYSGSDGNGIFKYDPNNITLDGTSKSFKSLSTKGLNS